MDPLVILSFDIEECDIPLEYGTPLSLEEQIEISASGTEALLTLLQECGVSASTFYTTATYAEGRKDHLRAMGTLGEIASHGVSHALWHSGDALESRRRLSSLSGQEVRGFRMPRMQPIAQEELMEAGYTYNSSLNPTYLPGRYNNLRVPRRPHRSPSGLLLFPSSVTPLVRFPLFWISAHLLPLSLYRRMVRGVLRHDGYVHLYFHPWEFSPLLEKESLGLPSYLHRRMGSGMQEYLRGLITFLKAEGGEFRTTSDFLEGYFSHPSHSL